MWFIDYSYIHTYIHTYVHTYICTYVHTYIRSYVRTYIHIYIRTYIRTYIHTYIHTAYIHTYIHTCIHTYVHTYILMYILHMYIRSYVRTYIHIYIHTYIHTCIHTYIRTYIHTYVHTYVHTFIRTYNIHTYVHTYNLHPPRWMEKHEPECLGNVICWMLPLATHCHTHYHCYKFHFVLFNSKIWLLSNIQQVYVIHTYSHMISSMNSYPLSSSVQQERGYFVQGQAVQLWARSQHRYASGGQSVTQSRKRICFHSSTDRFQISTRGLQRRHTPRTFRRTACRLN